MTTKKGPNSSLSHNLDTGLVGIFISLREMEMVEDNCFTPISCRKIFSHHLPQEHCMLFALYCNRKGTGVERWEFYFLKSKMPQDKEVFI